MLMKRRKTWRWTTNQCDIWNEARITKQKLWHGFLIDWLIVVSYERTQPSCSSIEGMQRRRTPLGTRRGTRRINSRKARDKKKNKVFDELQMVHHLAILLISFIVVCTLAQSASYPSVNSDLLELDQTSDPSNTSTPDPSSSLLPTTTPPSSTPTDQTSPPPTSPEASRIIIVVAGTTGALTTGTSPPTVPPYGS